MLHSQSSSIHKGAYIQSSDPGAVGAKVLWIDTTSGYVLKKRKDDDSGWDTIGAFTSITLSDGDKGDITVSGSGATFTIDNDVVTYAKMQNISVTDRLLGRDTTGAGDTEELTVSGGVEFTGSGGIQRSALTGDVTASAGSNSTTIANDAVTYAKMQNIATDSLVGRDTASAGDPETIGVTGGIEFNGSGSIRVNASNVGTGTLPIARGGTGSSTAPSDGKLLIGKTDGSYAVANLTAGTNVTITNGDGTVTIAASGGGGGGASALDDLSDVAISSPATGQTLAYNGTNFVNVGGLPKKLFDSTLGASANSIDTGAAGIAGGYDILEVWLILRTDEAVVASTASITVNNDTGSNYDRQFVRGDNITASASQGAAEAAWLLTAPGTSCASGVFCCIRLTIPAYTQTTANKIAECTHVRVDTTAANKRAELEGLHWRSTAAITRMAVTAPSTKNFVAGSRMIIYGR